MYKSAPKSLEILDSITLLVGVLTLLPGWSGMTRPISAPDWKPYAIVSRRSRHI